MKKILLASMLLGLSTSAFSQATGTMQPFLEEFTQASCPPCASQNPAFNTLIDSNQMQNGFQVNSLKYQVSWPGYDPMYDQNPAEVDARVSYYGVTGVPRVLMNGNGYNGSPSGLSQAHLNNAAAQAAPIEIDVNWTWSNASLNAIDITVTVTNTNSGNPFSTADKLHVALVEEEINFSSPPGSTNERHFFMVMRDMLPNQNGTALGTVAAGTPQTFTFMNQPVPPIFYNLNNVGVVAFAQKNSTKQVFNSDYQGNPGFPSGTGNTIVNMDMAPNAPALPSYCTPSYTPSVLITNMDNNTTIDSFEVSYTHNGGTPVSQLITTPLAPSASTTISFPAISVTTSSTVDYAYDINSHSSSLVDVTPINNVANDGDFVLLSTFTAVGPSISTTFDGLALGTNAPANAIADNPEYIPAYSVDNGINTSVTWNLGGFGASNGCFRWDFWSISSGRSSKLVYEKIDLSAVPSNATVNLNWSHAYAQKLFFNTDGLEVKVSLDCGATWTSIWNKSGSQLATAPASTNSRFYPQVTEWTADVADLTPYIGQSEVLVAFEGTSNNGNSLYIDDVNTEVIFGVNTTTIPTALTVLDVFPNPVQDQMTLEFFLAEATDMQLSIVNALGQEVQPIAQQRFDGNNSLTVNTSTLTAGVYFVRALTTDAVLTKRFVVE